MSQRTMNFTAWIANGPERRLLDPNVFIVDQQVAVNKHMQHRGAFDFKDWPLPEMSLELLNAPFVFWKCSAHDEQNVTWEHFAKDPGGKTSVATCQICGRKSTDPKESK